MKKLLNNIIIIVCVILSLVIIYENKNKTNTKVKEIEVTRVERTETGELITLDINGELYDYYYEY